jgi:hypothetical protein
VYYKLNNAYAIQPQDRAPVIAVGRGMREFLDASVMPLEPLTSKLAVNRAKRALLRDTTALNWLVATRADASTQRRPDLAKPTIGSDPEIFLHEDGTLIPAFDVLPSKHQATDVFWDGFQAEMTTTSQSCLQQNVENLQGKLHTLLDTVRAKRPKAELLAQDAVKINPKGISPEHLALGCDPSLNLYGVAGDLPPNPAKLPWRFAGGHIHFGSAWLANHPSKAEAAAKIVRDLDKVLAVWSVGAFGAFEREKIRRRYYGLAGEFRLPPHGLEYRTLGNGWMAHPGITQLTWEIARAIFQLSRCGLLDFWYGDDELVQSVVNNYDVETARKMLRKNEKLFVWMVSAANETFQLADCGAEKVARRALQVGLEGVECAVAKPLEIEGNWQLVENKRLAGEYSKLGYPGSQVSADYKATRAIWRTWTELCQKMS